MTHHVRRPHSPDAETVENILSAARVAPAVQHAASWQCQLDAETSVFAVRASLQRQLDATDLGGRALHLSAGAALFNLRVAVTHFGWEPVLRLLPHSPEPELLATIRLAGAPTNALGRGPDYYDVIWRHHRAAGMLSPAWLPPTLRAELTDAAQLEGARLHWPEAAEVDWLLQLTKEADRRNSGDGPQQTHPRRWLRGISGKDSDSAREPTLASWDSGGRAPSPDVGAARSGGPWSGSDVADDPTLAVLSTGQDGRADWLRSGQALQRLLLIATAHGLRASLLHQALEWPDLRWPLRDRQQGPAAVQMLIQLGYATPGREERAVTDEPRSDT